MTFELEERRIDVADLTIGMFVCRLDRPWEQTPFPLQGVELAQQSDVEAVQKFCRFVYVDARRRSSALAQSTLIRSRAPDGRFKSSQGYSDQPVETEVPRARQALDNAMAAIKQIFADISSGLELSAERVEQAVRPIVASVLRNADAFFWVESLRERDTYSYRHAINCSALATAFGRHMGFAEDTIISLAAGGFLMDVGKTQVSPRLLEHPGPLEGGEVRMVQQHVAAGVAILQKSSIRDPDVLDVVRTHHERYDGSGYPNGSARTDIPLAGRMLGLIDTYDAMTSWRPYRQPISRHHALRQIYAVRDMLFQTELVEQFQVCLGVYPTGSLVELSTGEIAVVLGQNKVRRLRPKVVILSSPQKQPLDDFRWVDLMNTELPEAQVDIAQGLAVGAFGFDAAELFLTRSVGAVPGTWAFGT